MRKFLTLTALDLVCVVYQGLAVMLLWGWYVAPALNLPAFNLASGIGLSLLFMVLAYQKPPEEHSAADTQMKAKLFYNFFIPTFAIAVGFIVHLFA